MVIAFDWGWGGTMRIFFLAMAAPSLLLGGCKSSTFTDRSARLELPPPPASPVISTDKSGGKASEKIDQEQVIVENFRAANASARNYMTQRQYRDSIIWRIIAKDDDSFHTFARDVRSDRALMNMSADGGAIFLNGLAAVTGTAAEKAALAVLSGGLLSAKGSVDRQLFNQETMTALLARMKAARLAALVPIKRGLSLSAETYPLEQALVDLRAYANAGSLIATIEAITTDAGKVAKTAEVEIEIEARNAAFLDSLDQRDKVGERVVALKGKQLTFLAIRMDGYIASVADSVRTMLAQYDPHADRYNDPDIALGYLTRWLADDAEAGDAEWQEAVTAAEKVKP